MDQVAYSFDKETVRKIIKGCMHAAIVGAIFAGGDYLIEQAATLHFADPLIEGFAITVVSAGYNAVREYIRGEVEN